MKIALTTQRNDDFKSVAELTVPLMQEYCTKHGYSLHALHINDVDVIKSRGRVIASLLPKYDAVVHIDADCLLTNLNISIEQIADFSKDWHIAASGNGTFINDGVCIWRKRESVEIFLSLFNRGQYGDAILQDAVAISQALDVYNPPPCMINACIPEEYHPAMPESARWNPGDFCLHLLAINNSRRVLLIREHINLIQR